MKRSISLIAFALLFTAVFAQQKPVAGTKGSTTPNPSMSPAPKSSTAPTATTAPAGNTEMNSEPKTSAAPSTSPTMNSTPAPQSKGGKAPVVVKKLNRQVQEGPSSAPKEGQK